MGANLLILGAGSYGAVIREIASETDKYEKIDFFEELTGEKEELDKFAGEYSHVAVAVDDPELRLSLIRKAEEKGFTVPEVISKKAYVSPSARVSKGVVAEPFAVIRANAVVGTGVRISAGAVICCGATVCDGCDICNNAVVTAGVRMAPNTTIKPCEVVYPARESRAGYVPRYDKREKWVRDYIEKTGREPSFFE